MHFPEDGKRHEIIGGVHYVTPSPITRHQRISRIVEQYVLEGETYRVAGRFHEAMAWGGVPGVEVDLTKVW